MDAKPAVEWAFRSFVGLEPGDRRPGVADAILIGSTDIGDGLGTMTGPGGR